MVTKYPYQPNRVETPPTPARTASGYVLGLDQSKPLNNYTAGFFGLFFVVFWNGITITVFTGFLTSGQLQTSPLLILFFIPFFLIGLGFLIAFVRSVWIAARLAAPELRLETWPLRPGSSVPLHFSRQLRNGALGPGSSLNARLICAEVARYTVGTDTTTVSEVLWQQPLDAPASSGSDAFRANWTVTLPGTLPESFLARHNRIEYQLEVTTQAPGIPSDTVWFPLWVSTASR